MPHHPATDEVREHTDPQEPLRVRNQVQSQRPPAMSSKVPGACCVVGKECGPQDQQAIQTGRETLTIVRGRLAQPDEIESREAECHTGNEEHAPIPAMERWCVLAHLGYEL